MTENKENTKYIEAVGRRKTSVARVRLTPASKNSFEVNDKPIGVYFPTVELQEIIKAPLAHVGVEKFKISIKASGGGVHSQAQAVAHGIARAIASTGRDIKLAVAKAGMLTRDPRAKERRKFGLKKARKSPQWSKR